MESFLEKLAKARKEPRELTILPVVGGEKRHGEACDCGGAGCGEGDGGCCGG